MTSTSLHNHLRFFGWAAIIGCFVQHALKFSLSYQKMAETGVEGVFLIPIVTAWAVGFGLQLPIYLTIACLCLAAARVLANEQQTLQSVFE